MSAYLGSSIGTAVAYPLFGLIIKISSWEWVFHSCGIAGAIWYIMWLYFVRRNLTFTIFMIEKI